MEIVSPIVDIGVNLMHRSFHQDREAVVEQEIAGGVTRLVITTIPVNSFMRLPGNMPGSSKNCRFPLPRIRRFC